jgi:hypothetical protein
MHACSKFVGKTIQKIKRFGDLGEDGSTIRMFLKQTGCKD